MNDEILDNVTNTRIIENIDNNTIFIFIIIIIMTMYYFSQFDININILLGFIISMIVIYYLYNDNIVINKRNSELLKVKKYIGYIEPVNC